MNELIEVARDKGLFVAQTLKCDIFILHRSASGYDVFAKAVFRGTLSECMEVLDEA